MTTAFLHPGAMGSWLAASCTDERLWCSAGRSDESRVRAAAAGLGETTSLAELVGRADAIVSVCPPGEAETVAGHVIDAGFDGIYVDANAIAPATSRRIADRFDSFVDGGIIGPPGAARLYLSGDPTLVANVAARWPDGGEVAVRPMAAPVGAASALKTSFATWTKASGAMLLTIRALAEAEGVDGALVDEWADSIPDLPERSEVTAWGTAPKAWRFIDEMRQHAAAFDEHDLPTGFADGAADLYARMAGFKGRTDVTLAEAIAAIQGN